MDYKECQGIHAQVKELAQYVRRGADLIERLETRGKVIDSDIPNDVLDLVRSSKSLSDAELVTKLLYLMRHSRSISIQYQRLMHTVIKAAGEA